MSHGNGNERVNPLRLLLSTTPALAVLLAVIVSASCVLVYSQLSRIGEEWFPDYNRLLRLEPTKPDCDPARFVVAPPDAKAEGGDELDDLLDDDDDDEDEAAAPAPSGEEAVLDDLLDDDDEEDEDGATKAPGPP